MQTYEIRLATALFKRGYVEDKLDKSRYRAFKREGNKAKVFVGQFGALRTGEVASRSRSIGDPQNQTEIYKKLLAEGAAASHEYLSLATPSS